MSDMKQNHVPLEERMPRHEWKKIPNRKVWKLEISLSVYIELHKLPTPNKYFTSYNIMDVVCLPCGFEGTFEEAKQQTIDHFHDFADAISKAEAILG